MPTTKDRCYFGGCPECGETDGYVNTGAAHWFVCNAHRVRWFVGINLFSSWKDETESEQRAIWAKVQDYRDVTPTRAKPAPAVRESTTICELPF